MQLTFFFVTVLFWLANSAFVKLMYLSIQPGQWLDMLFNWQDHLNKWYQSNSRFYNGLAKAAGDCQQCFSVWLTFISWWCYVLFMNVVLHSWITDGLSVKHGTILYFFLAGLINIIWYMVYWCIGSVFSLFVVLFKRKR